MRGDGVGAENMAGKRVELRGTVPEEESEGNRREGVRIGVAGGVCEDHVAFFLRVRDAYKIEIELVVRDVRSGDGIWFLGGQGAWISRPDAGEAIARVTQGRGSIGWN